MYVTAENPACGCGANVGLLIRKSVIDRNGSRVTGPPCWTVSSTNPGDTWCGCSTVIDPTLRRAVSAVSAMPSSLLTIPDLCNRTVAQMCDRCGA